MYSIFSLKIFTDIFSTLERPFVPNFERYIFLNLISRFETVTAQSNFSAFSSPSNDATATKCLHIFYLPKAIYEFS